jgi:coenzyme Q-binding protein COQ10
MPEAVRSITVNVPIEKFWAVIADFGKYPEFLSEIRKCTIADAGGGKSDVSYTIELALPVLNVTKTINYTLRMVPEPPKKLSWTLVKGDLKQNRGSWVLASEGEGKTKVTYTLEIGVGLLIPNVVTTVLAEQQLPKMLENFKLRAEKLNK